MKIETEQLSLREMTEADFDALYTVLGDSDIMEHYPYTFDAARVRNWIIKNQERYRVFGFGLWAVCRKESGAMIGDCGLTMQNINGTILPEIGYHIAKTHQRCGYAKEASRAVLDWTFRNTPFGTVYSYMKKENAASSATARARAPPLPPSPIISERVGVLPAPSSQRFSAIASPMPRSSALLPQLAPCVSTRKITGRENFSASLARRSALRYPSGPTKPKW